MLGPTFYAWNGEWEEYFNVDKYANDNKVEDKREETDETKCK